MHPYLLTLPTPSARASYFGPNEQVLKVSFLESEVPQDLRTRILSHMNAWQPCSISFELVSVADKRFLGPIEMRVLA